MLRTFRPAVVVLFAAMLLPAQSSPIPQPADRVNTVGEFPRHLLNDQKAIWTSPLKIRGHDLFWIAPFGAATGALIATDDSSMRHLSTSPDRLRISRDVSNVGVGAIAGGAGAAYVIGHFTANEHARETGVLAAEALADGIIADNVLKLATRRDRPEQPGSTGRFWSDGFSFPSEHGTVAWSVASMFAHEYPGTMTQLLAYGAATAVSVSRVTARKHFPSDVLVGSTMGYLIGRYVYRSHHRRELGGANIGTFERGEPSRVSAPISSTFLPLNSWAYVVTGGPPPYIHGEKLTFTPAPNPE